MFIRIGRNNQFEFMNHLNITYEFHILKELRRRYELEDDLFSITGNVVFANFGLVRKFVHKLNEKRSDKNKVQVGEVNAAGLIDEIYHFILREYEKNENPKVFRKAIDHLNKKVGEDNFRKLLFEFIDLFPSKDVYRGKASVHEYLSSYTDDKSNLEITLEEFLLLYLANQNPANKRLKELFDDGKITNVETYKNVISEIDEFFKKEKPFGPDHQDVVTFLKSPFINSPDNLWDQLEFIQNKWGVIIKDLFINRILTGKDLMKEDTKFDTFFVGGGAPPNVAPAYKGKVAGAEHLVLGKSLYNYAEDIEKDYDEPENFTPDIHWMPQVVMLAKNSYVWLDQLSKKYKREIRRLDQVPDEELDKFARWNFNALWLIGVWERSPASKRIKHIMGNIDAVASAYSLYDYTIAHALGGEEAYNNLNERCKSRGIRLASDMVPNHTGIYSDWTINKPDYFIQSPHSPFPNYQFNGEDLSEDPNIEIKIEDGYWRKNDAAVVFRRIDKRTGDTRYIYHGNDGTNMPWNDTAQLNMLKNEVREAVIQKIFDVARKFSIIRFDAAMTLTKRHFSRLWFPQPGKGGDIPSRADHALTKQRFDELFPEEFWREVVDRINKEMPETLLLAEAFWLMEGYFVRSLGMHRVYNSAFMHMFMKEENEKYRDLITNTLEFEPEILKRYVNFMSNPDEETAIRQFGTDDKYFGVLTMMLTLPGLPMVAHGQVEGFTEKYGMEYQRAYYNEEPKHWLIERHEREAFPLMRKRYLFAEIENFWFYDCIDGYGHINENVFAFTNRYGDEKALVLYNNRYEQSNGKITTSTPKLVSEHGSKTGRTVNVIDQLGVKTSANHFYRVYDQITQLEYLWRGIDFTVGLHVNLNGFEHHVYLGFTEIYDDSGEYYELYHELNGRGVPDIERARQELKLKPVHDAFVKLFNENQIDKLVDELITDVNESEKEVEAVKQLIEDFSKLLKHIRNQISFEEKIEDITDEFSKSVNTIKELNLLLDESFNQKSRISNQNLRKSIVTSPDANYKENLIVLLLYLIIKQIKKINELKEKYESELFLAIPFRNSLRILGRGEEGIFREITLINTLLQLDAEFKDEDKLIEKIISQMEKETVKSFLLVNEYEGTKYFSKERFEELSDWIFSLDILNSVGTGKNNDELISTISNEFKSLQTLKEWSTESGYKLKELKSKMKRIPEPVEAKPVNLKSKKLKQQKKRN